MLVALAEEADAEIPDDTSAETSADAEMCQFLGIQVRNH